MSDLELTMSLADKGGTISKRTQETRDLNGELDKNEQLIKRINNLINKTNRPKASYKAAMSDEGEDYDTARGIAGTGAASRDFAKQARGLGGLVHVYATFAANLFAVSAAFRALSDAADTTNMVKGLEQLGAASGTNLKLLSTQLIDATDGAISLKEAMKATAQASAAGMSTENIKKLGVAARQAGAALGIDASDALSRLSRGITKLEPELLDELGIFTKLEKATTDYARQLGKPVSALTEFERRQAFANAVLDEVNKKFGDIKIDSNPYSKLLASLKNAAQTMLEVVNEYLGPVVKLLAQSPTALMTGIAGLTGLLLRQAIPALSQWKKELHDTAEQSSAVSKRTKELFDNYLISSREQAEKAIPESVKSIGTAATAGMEEARKVLKSGARLYNKEFNAMMKLDTSDLTAEHTKVIEQTRTKLEAALKKAQGSKDPKKEANAQARLDTFNQVAGTMTDVISKSDQYNQSINKLLPSLSAMGKYHGDMAEKAALASSKYRLLANAIDNTQFVGPILAFKSMLLSIKEMDNGITKLGKVWLGFRGTMAIAATTAGMLLNAFSGVIGVIGTIITGVTMITQVFSTNRDAVERAGTSLDELKSNGENLFRTFERLSKLDPLEKLAPNNVAASANAMQSVAESIGKAISDTQKAIAERSTVDSATNWLADWIGKSDEKLLSKRLSKELGGILDAAAASPQTVGMRADLASLLGLDSTASNKSIIEAFEKQGEAGSKMLIDLTKKFNLAAQSNKTWAQGLEDTSKLFKDMENEFISSDKLSTAVIKVGKDFIDFGNIVKDDGVASLSAMVKMSESAESLAVLPKNLQEEILNVAPKLKELSTQLSENTDLYNRATQAVNIYTDAIAKKNEYLAKGGYAKDSNIYKRTQDEIAGLQRGAERAKEVQKEYQKAVAQDTSVISSYTDLFNKASQEGFKKSSDVIGRLVSDAIQKGAIAVEQAALSKGTRTKETIDRQNTLANKQIDLDLATQRTQLDLVIETKLLRLEMEKRNIEDKKVREANEKGLTGTVRSEYLKETPREKEIVAIQTALSSENRYKYKSAETLQLQGVSKAEALTTAQMTAGYAVKAEQAKTQKNINNLTAAVDGVNLEFEQEGKQLADRAKDVAASLALLRKTEGATLELRTLPEYQDKENKLLAQQTKLETDISEQTKKKAERVKEVIDGYVKSGKVIDESQRKQILADATLAENELKRGITASSLEITQTRINDAYAINNKLIDENLLKAGRRTELDQFIIDSDKQKFDLQVQLGRLTADEIMQQQRSFAIRQADLDAQSSVNNLTASYQKELDAINQQREIALSLTGALTEAEEAQYEKDKKRLDDKYTYEAERINRIKSLRKEAADAIAAQSDREIKYTDLFKQAFKGMEDAIVDFAKNGKLSFKSMIDSFIEGLLRYEIQQQQAALFQGVGGASGMAGWLAKMITGGPGYTVDTTGIGMGSMGAQDTALLPAGFKSAQGSAYDAGLRKFAQGGAFTNSIVTSPTLFKFAQGTGLMGEAGPEAIMPLKRDSSGNLGVRAPQQAPQTSVVVNNYGSEKATTKETTDSKGNRKIEVIIGDMVAQEVTRTGSATQQAMGATFGNRPALARR